LLAALAGGALAIAGVVMQAITRNPLGAPEILGINTGAAVVVALSITYFPGLAGQPVVVLAFIGAACAAALVFGIARFGRGGVSPVRLALAGVTVSILLYSLMQGTFIMKSQDSGSFFFWLIGGVGYASWRDIHLALPWMAAGFLLALFLAGRLNILALGDDVARGLGQNVGRTRFLGAVCVVLLAGAAVGVAGPIAFIGLIVPHTARKLVGNNHYILIPTSFLFGAALLLYADIVTRYLNHHVETPAGLVTALIGAPFFHDLARRETVAG
jgi:iron complex transport system permease protein